MSFKDEPLLTPTKRKYRNGRLPSGCFITYYYSEIDSDQTKDMASY